jgi:hypothetical protein
MKKKTHFEYGLLHIYTHHYTKFLILKNELQYFFLQYGLLEIIKMKKNKIFFT